MPDILDQNSKKKKKKNQSCVRMHVYLLVSVGTVTFNSTGGIKEAFMKRDKLIHTLLHGHSWMMLCKSRGLMHVQSKQRAQSVWRNRCSRNVLQLFLFRWHVLLKLNSLCNVWFVSFKREPNRDTVKSPVSTR